MTAEQMSGFGFLKGVRIIDLSQYIPGPYTTRLLADLGADVLKIEPPGGEPMRRISPAGPDGLAPEYKLINGGKTVIELDLKSDEGRVAFESLLCTADVLVESYRPGVLERLGLHPDRLRALNTRLIHCALSGWGQTGPYRDKPGHDVNYMALGGGQIASGTRDTPVITFPPVADYASALQAALTVVGALFARERNTTEGAHIDISIMETVLAWQGMSLARAAASSPGPQRGRELLNGGTASYNIYRTADDRFLSLGIVREKKFWLNFCNAVDRPDLIDRLDEPLPQDNLIRDVSALFAAAPLAHWCNLLADVDTCFEPLAEFSGLPRHPHIRAREILVVVEDGLPPTDVLYPAWINHAPPPNRGPVQFADLSSLPEIWRQA